MSILAAINADRRLRVIATFCVAAIGGALASLAGMPAGWVAGSLLATAAVSVAGLESDVPRRMRPVIYLALGIYAGTGVSPETVHQMKTWPFSFFILGVSLVAVIAVSYWYLHRKSGWDRNSALLASLPGALSFVMAAAEGLKADMKKVAVAQSLRLVILVELVPLGIFLVGAPPSTGHAASVPDASLADLAILVGCGAVAGIILERIGLAGGMILGGILSTGTLFLTGAIHAAIPGHLMVPFIVALGAISGSRFRPGDFRLILLIGRQSLVAFAMAMAISLVAAGTVSLVLGVHFLQTIMAFAPGALDALIVVAITLDIDPAYVAAHHVARFLALVIVLPFATAWIVGRKKS